MAKDKYVKERALSTVEVQVLIAERRREIYERRHGLSEGQLRKRVNTPFDRRR